MKNHITMCYYPNGLTDGYEKRPDQFRKRNIPDSKPEVSRCACKGMQMKRVVISPTPWAFNHPRSFLAFHTSIHRPSTVPDPGIILNIFIIISAYYSFYYQIIFCNMKQYTMAQLLLIFYILNKY